VKSVVGFEGDIVFDRTKPDGTPRKLMDVQLLSSLGWRAKIDFLGGLVNAYQDFMKNHHVKKH
jgi:GDP-L-fucose synthase